MSRNIAPVSCYIRTFNEARKIGDVVTAALEVAEEVVVVDSGSTDATVAIAQARARASSGRTGSAAAGRSASRRSSAATTMCSTSTPTRW